MIRMLIVGYCFGIHENAVIVDVETTAPIRMPKLASPWE